MFDLFALLMVIGLLGLAVAGLGLALKLTVGLLVLPFRIGWALLKFAVGLVALAVLLTVLLPVLSALLPVFLLLVVVPLLVLGSLSCLFHG